MDILSAIKREERKLEKNRVNSAQTEGIKAAAEAMGGLPTRK
jgi:hypothetical protein